MLEKQLEDFLHVKIPATNLLGFTVSTLNKSGLVLKAPLGINHNDKGTGFGGSIETLAIVAGWSMTWFLLMSSQIMANVVIKRSNSIFLAPVKGDFEAHCLVPSKEEIEVLFKKLTCKGKAHLDLHVKVLSEGILCMELHAEYVFLTL